MGMSRPWENCSHLREVREVFFGRGERLTSQSGQEQTRRGMHRMQAARSERAGSASINDNALNSGREDVEHCSDFYFGSVGVQRFLVVQASNSLLQ